MRNIFIFWILILPVSLFGQKDTAKLFEPSMIKADIDTLIHKLKVVHPTFLNYYNQNSIQDKIDSIKINVNYPMSSLDFFRIMQPFVSIDGHTTLIYDGEVYPKMDNPFFPFKVVIYNNVLYIKDNLSDNKNISKGSIIETINGIPTKAIINNLIRYRPGEKETYKLKSLEKDFHMYYQLVYGSFSEFDVTINKVKLTVTSAKWNDFEEPSRPNFELRFYDDDIAYIYKRMFMPPGDFIHFMDSAFNLINEKQIKYLIIDNLRGGGMTDLADSLMSYFADKPYRIIEKQMIKISPLTTEYIESKKSEGFINGDYFEQEFSLHNSRTNRFTGTVYILNGPLSYSAATSFPAAAKCYQNAINVGEETGQPLLSNGGMSRFTLSNTKLSCYTSLSEIYMPCNNNDTKKGVIPDYKVIPTIEDLLNDKDYTLEYTLNLIRKNIPKN